MVEEEQVLLHKMEVLEDLVEAEVVVKAVRVQLQEVQEILLQSVHLKVKVVELDWGVQVAQVEVVVAAVVLVLSVQIWLIQVL